MHPWYEISTRSTLIDLVGSLEGPIEGREGPQLRPWPYQWMLSSASPSGARCFLVVPSSTPVKLAYLSSISSQHLRYLNPGSSATHRQIVVSTTLVDTSPGTIECLNNKIQLDILPQDHQPVPSCHLFQPVCLSACLAAWNPCLSFLLLPPALVVTILNLWFNQTSVHCAWGPLIRSQHLKDSSDVEATYSK